MDVLKFGKGFLQGGGKSRNVSTTNCAAIDLVTYPEDDPLMGSSFVKKDTIPLPKNEAARKGFSRTLEAVKQPTYPYLSLYIQDFSFPANLDRKFWEILAEDVKALLKAGTDVVVFCQGGHGRTGMVLAILAALIDPSKVQGDPVVWLRKVYCHEAVETEEQYEYVCKILGIEVSKEISFPKYVAYSGYSAGGYEYGTSGYTYTGSYVKGVRKAVFNGSEVGVIKNIVEGRGYYYRDDGKDLFAHVDTDKIDRKIISFDFDVEEATVDMGNGETERVSFPNNKKKSPKSEAEDKAPKETAVEEKRRKLITIDDAALYSEIAYALDSDGIEWEAMDDYGVPNAIYILDAGLYVIGYIGKTYEIYDEMTQKVSTMSALQLAATVLQNIDPQGSDDDLDNDLPVATIAKDSPKPTAPETVVDLESRPGYSSGHYVSMLLDQEISKDPNVFEKTRQNATEDYIYYGLDRESASALEVLARYDEIAVSIYTLEGPTSGKMVKVTGTGLYLIGTLPSGKGGETIYLVTTLEAEIDNMTASEIIQVAEEYSRDDRVDYRGRMMLEKANELEDSLKKFDVDVAPWETRGAKNANKNKVHLLRIEFGQYKNWNVVDFDVHAKGGPTLTLNRCDQIMGTDHHRVLTLEQYRKSYVGMSRKEVKKTRAYLNEIAPGSLLDTRSASDGSKVINIKYSLISVFRIEAGRIRVGREERIDASSEPKYEISDEQEFDRDEFVSFTEELKRRANSVLDKKGKA